MATYGIIILAAGNSSRLGQPKQLLRYHQKSLMKHTVDEALAVPGTFTVVVTGAESSILEKELEGTEAKICHNPNWAQGMASSIKKGLNEIRLQQPQVSGCLLLVCDQPFISKTIINNLIEEQLKTNKHIIASAYAGTAGTPVLFSAKYFDELLNLEGQEGAKKLLIKYKTEVGLTPFENGEIDIDTAEDYKQLTKKKVKTK